MAVPGPWRTLLYRPYIHLGRTVNSRMLDRMGIESVTLTHHVETTEDRKKTEPVCGDPALDAPPRMHQRMSATCPAACSRKNMRTHALHRPSAKLAKKYGSMVVW